MTEDIIKKLEKEIDGFINMAIENKEHEIQVMLTDYKYQHFKE